MFQCCSLEPSHPRLFPQSLKDCSMTKFTTNKKKEAKKKKKKSKKEKKEKKTDLDQINGEFPRVTFTLCYMGLFFKYGLAFHTIYSLHYNLESIA